MAAVEDFPLAEQASVEAAVVEAAPAPEEAAAAAVVSAVEADAMDVAALEAVTVAAVVVEPRVDFRCSAACAAAVLYPADFRCLADDYWAADCSEDESQVGACSVDVSPADGSWVVGA